MVLNKPVGDNAREGAVNKRTQRKTAPSGEFWREKEREKIQRRPAREGLAEVSLLARFLPCWAELRMEVPYSDCRDGCSSGKDVIFRIALPLQIAPSFLVGATHRQKNQARRPGKSSITTPNIFCPFGKDSAMRRSAAVIAASRVAASPDSTVCGSISTTQVQSFSATLRTR
jgi:hypothetical protein